MFNDKQNPIPNIFRTYIAPLDGLRALSILIVILAHTLDSNNVPDSFYTLYDFLKINALGVYLFFFISGFLITGLLLKEQHNTGEISFKGFYWRRFVRIFPVFYIFLLLVFIASNTGLAEKIYNHEFLAALLYYTNFNHENIRWFLGHTWSLSVEEQYYLMWPWLIVLLVKKGNLKWFALFIVYHVLSNVIGYRYDLNKLLLVPFFQFFPFLFAGSLMSILLFKNEKKIINSFQKINNIWPVIILFVMLFVVNYFPNHAMFGKFFLPFGMLLMSSLIYLFFGFILFGRKDTWRTFFSMSALRFIGKISYSWYIWQQIFITIKGRYFFGENSLLNIYPYNVVASFIAAVLSYYLVEQTFLKLKGKVN